MLLLQEEKWQIQARVELCVKSRILGMKDPRSYISVWASRYITSRSLSTADNQLISRLTEELVRIFANTDFEVTRDNDAIRIAGRDNGSGHSALLLAGTILRLPLPRPRRLNILLEAVGRNVQEFLGSGEGSRADDFEPHVEIGRDSACIWWGERTSQDTAIKLE